MAAKNLTFAGDSPFKSPKALRQEFEYSGVDSSEGLRPQLIPELVVVTQMPGVDADAGCL